jgi:hypothetical protein
MTIYCLFNELAQQKYIIPEHQAFFHLRDLLSYLDTRYGKGNWQVKFDYKNDT